uniref:Uncharacterized protein n=1 Tax=Rhizophora mucronata TaxID=61149 RepID=A0A2P2IMB3_RHIMU
MNSIGYIIYKNQ